MIRETDHRTFNAGRNPIIRLTTPMSMRYDDAYAKAHPFDKIVEGMMQPDMVRETAEIMRKAVEDNVETSVIINNRAGGNAPIIAQKVAEEFLRK